MYGCPHVGSVCDSSRAHSGVYKCSVLQGWGAAQLVECSPNIQEAWVQTVEMHTPHPADTACSPRDLVVEASAGVTLDYRVSATLVAWLLLLNLAAAALLVNSSCPLFLHFLDLLVLLGFLRFPFHPRDRSDDGQSV